MDGFLKESQRRVGAAATGSFRIARKDFTFSDGTVVPAGTKIAAPSYSILHNEANYPDPET
ncbi:hypothetical protein PQX77_011428 [Marasmius sp. AFHP31]|nr:hypothetical protein PQX77_011428 [Marasmius sp. AFHP31]